MKTVEKLRAWLRANRTSTRMAFILQMISMAVGTLLSLLWTRLLLRAMGDSLYGLFQNFLAASRIGGVGDLGISGAIGIKGGTMLSSGENDQLRKLLASARSLFLFLAALHFFAYLILCPWLPQWLHFKSVPGMGSLPFLFFWAGISGAVLIIAGYFANLNYAYGTVTWPLLPGLFIGQILAPLVQWQLAKMHAPLWEQNLPYVIATIISGCFAWKMLKWSHAWLGEWRPLHFDFAQWKILFLTSGWVYLCIVCNTLYFNTDCLVIGAGSAPGFGPATIPMYQANYKPCALVVGLISSASFVSMPKIAQWIASSLESDRKRLFVEAHRLNIFQIILGCGAALGYLALINWFVTIWLGAKYQCPLAWQTGFACNLAVTTGGAAAISIATRCGDSGLKKAGLVAGFTAFLNLGLALLFMKWGSITGISFAAVVSQSVFSLMLGYFICRRLGFPLFGWMAKSWLLPLGIVLTGAALKFYFPQPDFLHVGILVACYAGLFIVAVLLAGLNLEMLRSEIATIRGMLKI